MAFGGWTLDDVVIEGRRISDPPPLTTSGSNLPGRVFNLEVNGNPGDPWVLFAAIATAPTLYPGIGTASIDISNAVSNAATFIPIVLTGTLPTTGQLTIPITVPAASGVTVWFQGAIGLDAVASELLVTNVVALSIP